MLITPVRLISNNPMTSDASVVQQLINIWGYSIQAVYSGSPNGTLKLQASNDYDPKTGNGDWTDIEDSSNSITGAGTSTWNVTASNYAYVRFYYTRSSGSGTLNVYFYGRGY